MAEIIAVGTPTASSADFTLVDGQSTTLSIKDSNGEIPKFQVGGRTLVQLKSGSGYGTVGELTFAEPCKVLVAPGTYRVLRRKAQIAYGVDRN